MSLRNVFSFCIAQSASHSHLLRNNAQYSQMKTLFSQLKNFHCWTRRTPECPNFKQTVNQFSTHRLLCERSVRHKKSFIADDPGSIRRQFSRLVRPFGFMVTVSATCFGGAAIWQYESLRTRAKNYLKAVDSNYKTGSLRQHINAWWNQFSAGQQVVLGIIGLNVIVSLMWKIPSLQPVMVKYFCSNPAIGAPCWSMLFSTFSHYSFLHLGVNMYVLWSFSNVAVDLFGKEQFLAMYLSGGLVSSFASYVVKILRGSLQPSLGASGAILCVLGAVCQSYPDSRLSIAFVSELFPHSFSAQTGLYCILLFDSLGVLFDWHFFDHAAHLGGALFGVWYAKFGHQMIWKKREPIVRMWHSVRAGITRPPK